MSIFSGSMVWSLRGSLNPNGTRYWHSNVIYRDTDGTLLFPIDDIYDAADNEDD